MPQTSLPVTFILLVLLTLSVTVCPADSTKHIFIDADSVGPYFEVHDVLNFFNNRLSREIVAFVARCVDSVDWMFPGEHTVEEPQAFYSRLYSYVTSSPEDRVNHSSKSWLSWFYPSFFRGSYIENEASTYSYYLQYLNPVFYISNFLNICSNVIQYSLGLVSLIYENYTLMGQSGDSLRLHHVRRIPHVLFRGSEEEEPTVCRSCLSFSLLLCIGLGALSVLYCCSQPGSLQDLHEKLKQYIKNKIDHFLTKMAENYLAEEKHIRNKATLITKGMEDKKDHVLLPSRKHKQEKTEKISFKIKESVGSKTEPPLKDDHQNGKAHSKNSDYGKSSEKTDEKVKEIQLEDDNNLRIKKPILLSKPAAEPQVYIDKQDVKNQLHAEMLRQIAEKNKEFIIRRKHPIKEMTTLEQQQLRLQERMAQYNHIRDIYGISKAEEFMRSEWSGEGCGDCAGNSGRFTLVDNLSPPESDIKILTDSELKNFRVDNDNCEYNHNLHATTSASSNSNEKIPSNKFNANSRCGPKEQTSGTTTFNSNHYCSNQRSRGNVSQSTHVCYSTVSCDPYIQRSKPVSEIINVYNSKATSEDCEVRKQKDRAKKNVSSNNATSAGLIPGEYLSSANDYKGCFTGENHNVYRFKGVESKDNGNFYFRYSENTPEMANVFIPQSGTASQSSEVKSHINSLEASEKIGNGHNSNCNNCVSDKIVVHELKGIKESLNVFDVNLNRLKREYRKFEYHSESSVRKAERRIRSDNKKSYIDPAGVDTHIYYDNVEQQMQEESTDESAYSNTTLDEKGDFKPSIMALKMSVTSPNAAVDRELRGQMIEELQNRQTDSKLKQTAINIARNIKLNKQNFVIENRIIGNKIQAFVGKKDEDKFW